MDHGKLVQVETPDRIYEMPNSVYVADFIGDVNIIEGRARFLEEGQYEIDWAEGQQALHAATSAKFDNGQTCYMAIRPEKITITADKPEAADNCVQGKIHDIAYLGNLSTYHVELPNGTIIKAQTANTRRIARRSFTWEDQVWLSWTATAGVMLAR